MMEVAGASEMSADFYRTTRRKSPEDGHLQGSCFFILSADFCVFYGMIFHYRALKRPLGVPT
jgi:hypothetical protein